MAGSGFPNAAEEAGTEPLNLHKLVVKSPASTFFMRSEAHLAPELGISSGDLLIVDRSLALQSGDVVVAVLDGDFIVRQYRGNTEKGYLVAGVRYQKPLEVSQANDLQIWGVVSHVVHSYRGAY
jgi:DNA polymerase V